MIFYIKVFSVFIAGISGIIGVLFEFRNKHKEITTGGKVTILLISLSSIAGLTTEMLERESEVKKIQDESKRLERTAGQLERILDRTESIRNEIEENAEIQQKAFNNTKKVVRKTNESLEKATNLLKLQERALTPIEDVNVTLHLTYSDNGLLESGLRIKDDVKNILNTNSLNIKLTKRVEKDKYRTLLPKKVAVIEFASSQKENFDFKYNSEYFSITGIKTYYDSSFQTYIPEDNDWIALMFGISKEKKKPTMVLGDNPDLALFKEKHLTKAKEKFPFVEDDDYLFFDFKHKTIRQTIYFKRFSQRSDSHRIQSYLDLTGTYFEFFVIYESTKSTPQISKITVSTGNQIIEIAGSECQQAPPDFASVAASCYVQVQEGMVKETK